MDYPTCDICDEYIDYSGDKHVCNKSDILERFRFLEERATKAERRLERINDTALKLFSTLPELDLDMVCVDVVWLKKLWEALECNWDYQGNTLDLFHIQWMATHRVLCEAFDVFRSFHNHGINKTPSLLEKLKVLHEFCIKAAKTCNYDDESLDMTPEELVKNAQPN